MREIKYIPQEKAFDGYDITTIFQKLDGLCWVHDSFYIINHVRFAASKTRLFESAYWIYLKENDNLYAAHVETIIDNV